MIFPGLSRPSGSKVSFTRRIMRITLRPHHERDELAAQPAVAVLAGERAAIFLHERRDVGGDAAKHLPAALRFQIEERTRVQFPAPACA